MKQASPEIKTLIAQGEVLKNEGYDVVFIGIAARSTETLAIVLPSFRELLTRTEINTLIETSVGNVNVIDVYSYLLLLKPGSTMLDPFFSPHKIGELALTTAIRGLRNWSEEGIAKALEVIEDLCLLETIGLVDFESLDRKIEREGIAHVDYFSEEIIELVYSPKNHAQRKRSLKEIWSDPDDLSQLETLTITLLVINALVIFKVGLVTALICAAISAATHILYTLKVKGGH